MLRIAALAILAVAAAGCGGSAKQVATPTVSTTTTVTITRSPAATAYVARMHALGNRLGAATDGLYPLDSGTPGSAVSRATSAKLLRARVTLDKVAAELATIHAPSVVAADQRRLRTAVLQVSAQIGLLVKSLRSGDSATFNSLAQLPALRGVITATDAMKRKGYDIVAP